MSNKTISLSLIVVALIAIGAYFYPQAKSLVGGVSSSGSYTNVATWALVNFVPSAANGTSTSILNSGASDRAITSSYAFCTNNTTSIGPTSPGIASLTLQAATTSVASQGLQGSANYIVNVNISTTTTSSYVSTSTEGVITGSARIWPVNTYLTFNFNATTTAACTIGVQYLPE
jgi:hypothetical protein